MIASLRSRLAERGLGAARSSVASLVATLGSRGGAALGGLYFSVVLARIAGADGLGIATQILSFLLIACIVLRFGTDQTLIRIIARLAAQGHGPLGRGIFVRCLAVVGAVSTLVAIGTWFAIPFIVQGNTADIARILVVALPALALVNVASGYLKGLKWSALGALVEIGAISGLAALLAVLTGASTLLGALEQLVVVTYLVCAAGIIAGFILTPKARPGAEESDESRARLRGLLVGGLAFTIIGLSLLATQAGSFAIGGLALGDTEIGLLRGAERLALMVSFALTGINPFIAPRISAAWKTSGVTGVRAAYRKAVAASVAVAMPIALVLAAAGPFLLAFFGKEFIAAYPFLLVMLVGQLTHACMGSLNMVLTMTGQERAAMWISLATLAGGALALYTMSAGFGALGFASAYSLIMVCRELAMYFVVRRFFARGH